MWEKINFGRTNALLTFFVPKATICMDIPSFSENFLQHLMIFQNGECQMCSRTQKTSSTIAKIWGKFGEN